MSFLDNCIMLNFSLGGCFLKKFSTVLACQVYAYLGLEGRTFEISLKKPLKDRFICPILLRYCETDLYEILG